MTHRPMGTATIPKIRLLIALLLTVVFLLPACASIGKQLNSNETTEQQTGLQRLSDASDSQKRAALPRLVDMVANDHTETRHMAWQTLETLQFADGALALHEVLADTQLAPKLFAALRDYWKLYPQAERERLLALIAANDAQAGNQWLWKRLRDPQLQFDADSAYYAWLAEQTSPVDTMRMLDTLARDAHDETKAMLIAELVLARELSEQHQIRLLAVMENDRLDAEARLKISERACAGILPPELMQAALLSTKILPMVRVSLVGWLVDNGEPEVVAEALHTLLQAGDNPSEVRLAAARALRERNDAKLSDILATIASEAENPEDLRRLCWEMLSELDKRAGHAVALAVAADKAVSEDWRMSLLNELQKAFGEAVETLCINLCEQDAGSALCARAVEILKTHASEEMKRIEAARTALALKTADSLTDFISLYSAIPADVFVLMPLDVRLYANAVYELAIADHIIRSEVDAVELASFSDSAVKAVDCLSRAMDALKANQPEPEDCTGVSDAFKRKSDALMLKFAPVRDEAVHHVSLAAALTIKVEDPKLQARVQALFLRAEQLKAAFFINIWFKSARRQIVDIIAENPDAFETVDKEKPLGATSDAPGDGPAEAATP